MEQPLRSTSSSMPTAMSRTAASTVPCKISWPFWAPPIRSAVLSRLPDPGTRSENRPIAEGSDVQETVFVVKVSKFCNLRCHYCYEHRELHVRDVMADATLERLFAGVDAFGDELRARGVAPEFSFVWHGGEPLLLPPSWYERIVEGQKRHVRKFAYRNSVQTNLFGIHRGTLELVIAAG